MTTCPYRRAWQEAVDYEESLKRVLGVDTKELRDAHRSVMGKYSAWFHYSSETAAEDLRQYYKSIRHR